MHFLLGPSSCLIRLIPAVKGSQRNPSPKSSWFDFMKLILPISRKVDGVGAQEMS